MPLGSVKKEKPTKNGSVQVHAEVRALKENHIGIKGFFENPTLEHNGTSFYGKETVFKGPDGQIYHTFEGIRVGDKTFVWTGRLIKTHC